MRRPDRITRFNQREALGDQIGYGNGVCYGICIMLGSSIAARNERANLGSQGAYDLIAGNINDGTIRDYGVRYHQNVEQRRQNKPGYGRMPPFTPFLVICHISYGWTGKFWGTMSYFNYTWRSGTGNHACLVYRTHADTVLFDPNWGVALWNGDLPTTCNVLMSYNTIADMISYEYRRDCSVSVEGLEVLENQVRV